MAASVVIAALVTGLVSTTAASAQEPGDDSGAAPEVGVQPPVDNVFPVPMPYEVEFSDDWHACRAGCRRLHKGNDVFADEGTPAVAVESGVIIKVDNTDDGLGGITLWLRGDSGVAYYYAHNAVNLVAEGDRVARGQMIARVGRTGNAATTPPHIHFQVNVCGEISSDEPCTVNPFPYLRTWAQGMVDGGADAIGWYQPAIEAVGHRTEVGSPLPAYSFDLPGGLGDAGVVPVAGDWDADGRDSVGLYRRADATFHLRDEDGDRYRAVDFGVPGRQDVWPIAGDFDGNGRDTVGLYAQQEGTFVVLLSRGRESDALQVGTPGDTSLLPVVGDWDADGRDSLGLYRTTDGTLVRYDDDGTRLPAERLPSPGPRTMPIAGDFDGDGRDEVGAMNRDTAMFELPGPDPADPVALAAAWAGEAAAETDADAEAVTATGTAAAAEVTEYRTMRVSGRPGALPIAGDWNGRDLVTLDELRAIYGPVADDAKVAEGLPALNAAMVAAGINTPARKAAFLATVRSESGFRFDAVEAGNDSRYRGRGFIQLTGEANYRAAGEALGIDLVGDPDLALNPLASPIIAAWYWTMARNINLSADSLDMAAVNIAIGFAPTVRRDMMRCGDFIVALRYYIGGTTPDGVNCTRTAASAMLAFMAPMGTGLGGVTSPSGAVSLPPSAIPEGWVPTTPSPVPADPEPRTPPPSSSTTRPVPPSTTAPTAPPTTWEPDDTTTTTAPPSSTTSPSTSAPSTSTSAPPSSSTSEPSTSEPASSSSSSSSTTAGP
jgi:hypothetical protein